MPSKTPSLLVLMDDMPLKSMRWHPFIPTDSLNYYSVLVSEAAEHALHISVLSISGMIRAQGAKPPCNFFFASAFLSSLSIWLQTHRFAWFSWYMNLLSNMPTSGKHNITQLGHLTHAQTQIMFPDTWPTSWPFSHKSLLQLQIQLHSSQNSCWTT